MGKQYELRLAGEPSRESQMRQGTASISAWRPTGPNDHQGFELVDLSGNGAVRKPGRYAVKAKSNFLPPDATADEAFRLTLQQCKWHIAANIPAVVESHEVEGVHQLRVALRRLRVALGAFGEEFRTPPLEALRMRAKILAQGLAPARDLDVFMDALLEPAAQANGSVEAFAVLRARALVARNEAWADAVREASGLGFRTFLHDLEEAVDKRVWAESPRRRPSSKGLVVLESPAVMLSNRMLSHRLSRARKHARQLKSLDEAGRHELRIALKKLRYTAEFFAPLYSEKAVRPFVKRLSRMQDVLGLLQDVAVARKTLVLLVREPENSINGTRADLSFAAGMIYGWHLDRAHCAWRSAVRRWKRFAQVAPFWPVA